MRSDMSESFLKCFRCGKEYTINRKKYRCDSCNGILEVRHKLGETWFDPGISGVWRYKKIIHPSVPDEFIISRGEGSTHHYTHRKVSEWTGVDNISMKHEGENPTGSFKDRGMTLAVSEALRLGVRATICASTGNTSASAASYSSIAGIDSYVLIPKKNVSRAKLAQAIAYGAKIISVSGDFDSAMSQLQAIIEKNHEYYLLNSLNPWRIEGQKTIAFEIIEKNPDVDFISLPAGNLGNTTAIGKGLMELKEMGVIDKVPRIVSVQAEGASPFYNLWSGKTENLVPVRANTIASAIRIGNPVNWEKALKSIRSTNGIVMAVSDSEIMEAKRVIDSAGIGCEPASAASVAGIRKLVDEGLIDRTDSVVSIITGHILKDIDSISAMDSDIELSSFLSSSGLEIPLSVAHRP